MNLDEALLVSDEHNDDLVALDEALERLAKVDYWGSQAVQLRFFGGLDVEEVAERLKISRDTVMRDWRLASMAAPRISWRRRAALNLRKNAERRHW